MRCMLTYASEECCDREGRPSLGFLAHMIRVVKRPLVYVVFSCCCCIGAGAGAGAQRGACVCVVAAAAGGFDVRAFV